MTDSHWSQLVAWGLPLIVLCAASAAAISAIAPGTSIPNEPVCATLAETTTPPDWTMRRRRAAVATRAPVQIVTSALPARRIAAMNAGLVKARLAINSVSRRAAMRAGDDRLNEQLRDEFRLLIERLRELTR